MKPGNKLTLRAYSYIFDTEVSIQKKGNLEILFFTSFLKFVLLLLAQPCGLRDFPKEV